MRKSASTIGSVRVAIVVPRHGHTIVRRNRLKRQLRELARARVLPQPLSLDILIRARRDAYAATFDALGDDLSRAMEALSPRAESR